MPIHRSGDQLSEPWGAGQEPLSRRRGNAVHGVDILLAVVRARELDVHERGDADADPWKGQCLRHRHR